MNILILDPADSTGYCVARIYDDTNEARIVEYDYIDVVSDSKFLGDRSIDLMGQVGSLIEKHDIGFVVIEDYFFGSRFATGSSVNVHFRAAIHIEARRRGLEYEVLNVSEWKRWVAGKSTPTKEQKKKWGKQPAKKLMIQEALWHKYGFRFPNHSLSKVTQKPIFFRYDVVDAVGMAVFYLEKYRGVKSISMGVEVPEDVEFKKKPKAYFNYQED